MRKREDLVEIGDGNQILDLGLDPPGLIEALTLGTVPISTGVVEGTLSPTVIASLQVSAQSTSAARHHRMGHPSLVIAEAGNFPQVLSKNVG